MLCKPPTGLTPENLGNCPGPLSFLLCQIHEEILVKDFEVGSGLGRGVVEDTSSKDPSNKAPLSPTPPPAL